MGRLKYYIMHISSLSWQEYIALACVILLFVFLFQLIFKLLDHMTENKVISKGLENLYKTTEKDAKERRAEYETKIMEEGTVEKEDFLIKLDILIEQSGIKKRLKFLNSETYVIIGIISCCIGFLAVYQMTHTIFYGIATVLGILLIMLAFLMILANRNKKKIEDNIVNFVNLVENYSKTNDDIMNIFGKVYPFLEEPLRSDLENCYIEGTQTGNVDKALNNLSKRVNHKKFRDIIRNLLICSRYDANYSAVAEDTRTMLLEYIAGKKERQAMKNAARIELAIILVLSVFLMWLMGSFVSQDGTNIITVLTQTLIGNILLIYSLIVIIASIINIVLMGNMKD